MTDNWYLNIRRGGWRPFIKFKVPRPVRLRGVAPFTRLNHEQATSFLAQACWSAGDDVVRLTSKNRWTARRPWPCTERRCYVWTTHSLLTSLVTAVARSNVNTTPRGSSNSDVLSDAITSITYSNATVTLITYATHAARCIRRVAKRSQFVILLT